jgi:6-pyruvoyltetrahydropterin/6-carboxytetrahydropterin synthase
MWISREWKIQAGHNLPHVPEGHKCRRPHGHTWTVRVWVSGPLDPELGWIVDYADLDEAWDERVHQVLDHRVLNAVIDNPTTEHLAMWIYTRMANALIAKGVKVECVEIDEGDNGRCRLLADAAGGG